jgi:hypothetical protein
MVRARVRVRVWVQDRVSGRVRVRVRVIVERDCHYLGYVFFVVYCKHFFVNP